MCALGGKTGQHILQGVVLAWSEIISAVPDLYICCIAARGLVVSMPLIDAMAGYFILLELSNSCTWARKLQTRSDTLIM